MGCWRATCGLSNLPIKENDEIVAFLLKEKSLGELRGGQFAHAEDLFIPISAPIYGKYDGYGSVKNTESKYSDLILQQVKSLFRMNISGDKLSIKDNTSSINIEEASLEDLIYEFERGNVIQIANDEIMKLYSDSGEFHRGYYFTGLILFHKDIFDKLISLKCGTLSYQGVNEIYDLAKKFEQVDFKKEIGLEKFEVLMNQVIYESRLPRSEFKNFDIYLYWYKNSDDININDELLDFIKKGQLICMIMNLLNKPWMPQVISSQLEDNSYIFESLNNFVLSKMKQPKDNENEKNIISSQLPPTEVVGM